MYCRSLSFLLVVLFLLTIVLSILLRYMDSDYPFGIFWPLCCLFFFDIRILITPLVSSSSSCIYFSTKPYFVIHCFNVCNLVLYYSNVILSQDLTLSFLSSKDRVMLSEHKRRTCDSSYRY